MSRHKAQILSLKTIITAEMMMELSIDDTTSQINNGYKRAIGGCSLGALTTSDEAVVRDDKSIRRANLA